MYIIELYIDSQKILLTALNDNLFEYLHIILEFHILKSTFLKYALNNHREINIKFVEKTNFKHILLAFKLNKNYVEL